MKIKLPHTFHSIAGIIIAATLLLVSCEKFFEPEQGLIVDENEYFKDWNEYRAAELGLYALQQDLVSHLLILGELRGDLLNVTENASRDLIEVNLHQLTPGNKYSSPLPFYRLIGACNRLATKLEQAHPEVLKDTTPNIYDRLYGEVLCMRAWTYFSAVRIFKEVPYVWPSLTTVEEITEYVSQGHSVINPVTIIYSPDGYYNDTIYGDTVVLEKLYLDLPAIVDTFSRQLTEDVKIVGVVHHLVNGDATWDVNIWNNSGKNCLLGQMYLELGNYGKAKKYFDQILRYQRYNVVDASTLRYGVDFKFQLSNWKNIFTGSDPDEHIMTVWFNKTYQQQNELQSLFSTQYPNKYMLKPTRTAINAWEYSWREYRRLENDDHWELTKLDPEFPGFAGDPYRGYNVSYTYQRDGVILEPVEVKRMFELKRQQNKTAVREIMQGVDTVVNKYTIGKNSFDRDANFSVYRAAGIHLYYAEIYARWRFDDGNGNIKPVVSESLKVLNDGSYDFDPRQRGVRGRAALGSGFEAISLTDPIYIHHPETNEVIGFLDYSGNLNAKQIYLEDRIMDERIRELAFEGERFYDLMRIARRRDDPSYLANRVAAKFPPPIREQIRQHLLDEENWYLKIQ